MKHFKLIKAIVEEGNIAKSADKLHLTQSALSHQLREIEKQLGYQIFIRKRNSWELTQEGAELSELSKNVLGIVDQKLTNIHHRRHKKVKKFRISCECYSFYLMFPSFIEQMTIKYPDIQVELNFKETHNLNTKLINNEIDLAVVTKKQSIDSLLYKEIFEDEIQAIINRKNELAKKRYLEASDFIDAHLLIHSYPLETVSVYEHYLKPNNIHPKMISAIPLTEVLLKMVDSNFGIFCMPTWALQHKKFSENLIFKPIGETGLSRKLFISIRKNDGSKNYVGNIVADLENFVASNFMNNPNNL